MGIEAATFISDLQPANPGSSDLRSQGDDHIRLEKQVLQNTFPNASKAFYFPVTQSKTADFTVVAADMSKTFLVDTTAGIVNMTLPTLTAGDAGWETFLLKTNAGTSPVLVKAAAGNVSSGQYSVAAARRCIPNAKISCYWTGAGWVISRAPSVGGPVGAAIELHISALPVGYEWPNGQTLASVATNYPEFNAANGSGVTLDKRGRVGIILDNLGGSAAGRLGGGIITGTAIGNTGGTDVVTLSIAQLAAHNHGGVTGTMSANASHSHVTDKADGFAASVGSQGSGGAQYVDPNNGSTAATNTDHTHSIASQGGGGSHSNLGPSIIVAQVLIVE